MLFCTSPGSGWEFTLLCIHPAPASGADCGTHCVSEPVPSPFAIPDRCAAEPPPLCLECTFVVSNLVMLLFPFNLGYPFSRWVSRILCISWMNVLYHTCLLQIFSPTVLITSFSRCCLGWRGSVGQLIKSFFYGCTFSDCDDSPCQLDRISNHRGGTQLCVFLRGCFRKV